MLHHGQRDNDPSESHDFPPQRPFLRPGINVLAEQLLRLLELQHDLLPPASGRQVEHQEGRGGGREVEKDHGHAAEAEAELEQAATGHAEFDAGEPDECRSENRLRREPRKGQRFGTARVFHGVLHWQEANNSADKQRWSSCSLGRVRVP